MPRYAILSAVIASVLASTSSGIQAQNAEPSEGRVIEPILDRFVSDYGSDPMAIDITFGIELDGMRWRVQSKDTEDGRKVALIDGFGDEDLFYFQLDREALNLLDQGVWNGLTAMGAATSQDKTPLDILYTDGFERSAEHETTTRRLIFHFWTRGFPETVPFASSNSRVVHGAPATALYYDQDFRSAVYHIPAGLGREQAPTLTVPFPRMVIIISGAAEGDIAGQPFEASAGEMLFAPPNLPVTFWNASQEDGLSFVWLMWGQGA